MQTVRFLAPYARRYLTPLILTVVAMFALVGVQLWIPWVVKTLIAQVQQLTWGEEALAIVSRLALMLLGLFLVRAVLQFTRFYMAHVAGWGVVAESRQHIYEHLQRLSLRFYEDKQTGQLMSRMVNDSDMFEKLIAHAVPDVAVNLLTLIGVSAVLFSMSWQLALLSMIPVPLVFIAMRGFARYVRPAFRERQRELGQLNATLNDNLSGIREIKAFTQEEREALHIRGYINRYRDSLLRALRLVATFEPFIELTASLGTVVVIYFGGKLAFQQTLSIADLVAFFLYLDLFYQPVRGLSGAWESIQEALAGGDRVAELLAEEPELAETPGAVSLPGQSEGGLSLRDVSFAYGRGEPVLEDVTLEIPAGTIVALVGPTGVGKTTLAGLIPRFYDVTSGSIELDGRDIRSIRLDDLRRQISIVLQDVFLFHGTVRDNLLFGNPNATDAELIHAAQVANAEEFIVRLPEGYDTVIGERGIKLSGGQKQRLAIARAILRNAPILILDEATSAVDTETERLIQGALERLIVGRTTLIIAHRLSTVRNADQIVVLDGRRVVEHGTHRELMTLGGLYCHLVEVQSQVESQWQTINARVPAAAN